MWFLDDLAFAKIEGSLVAHYNNPTGILLGHDCSIFIKLVDRGVLTLWDFIFG